MNPRRQILNSYARLRGFRFPQLYAEHLQAVIWGDPAESAAECLKEILLHCQRSVPYYADLMAGLKESEIIDDPEACLRTLPILTKDIIRDEFEYLKSEDLACRKWYYNTSGGSTGIPIKLIQDKEYSSRARAVTMLLSRLIGCEEGEPVVFVWGSERDILQASVGIKARFRAFALNTTMVNAFRMTKDTMRECLCMLSRRPPKLIIAYAQSLYELACFAEREGIVIAPQNAAITSAGTLYEFMRQAISKVFQCPVYNRYGSREVGNIACERPGLKGLWTAPWGNYVDVVDHDGVSLTPGVEGDLIITCLTNFAMPLLRYQIGDRGVLAGQRQLGGQVLERVSGRNVDTFKLSDGTLIDGEYFTHLIYFRDWVRKFQVIQKEYDQVLFRMELNHSLEPPKAELMEIAAGVRTVMGASCHVNFEFPEEIAPASSGKFRFTISEIG
jgi:phenylacetate-CoA ligase